MRVRITDPAKADLNEIRLYLHSQSPNAAQKMGRRLREACLSLADFPNRNRLGSVPGARENVTV